MLRWVVVRVIRGGGIAYVFVINMVKVNGGIFIGSCHPPPATTTK